MKAQSPTYQQAHSKTSKQHASHNGVPVSSDASMKDWMGYVYQQQACPTNFTGVEVTINVVDANGNYRTIGTTTTDASGYYSYVMVPRHYRQIHSIRNIRRHKRLLAIITGNQL